MKAFVVEADLTRTVREIPEPKINDYMAKVKTIACAICGSDTKILHGNLKGTPMDIYPLVMGHEAVGEVVEVGSKVTSYKVGDKVIGQMNPVIEGGFGSAWGAFSEYGTIIDVNAPGAEVMGKVALGLGMKQSLLPDWVDPVDATMIITLKETLGACKRFNIDANESVAIYGMGPVGVSFVKFLKMRGAKPIIALSRSQAKMDLGLKAGADYIVNSEDPNLIEKIREIAPEGLDHVLDAVGSPGIWNEAMELLKEDGQICAYGVPGNTSADLDWTKNPHYNFHLNFYQMTSTALEYWANNQVLAMVKSGDINLKDYISAYFPFEEIVPVMDRFLNKEFEKKVVITF